MKKPYTLKIFSTISYFVILIFFSSCYTSNNYSSADPRTQLYAKAQSMVNSYVCLSPQQIKSKLGYDYKTYNNGTYDVYIYNKGAGKPRITLYIENNIVKKANIVNYSVNTSFDKSATCNN